MVLDKLTENAQKNENRNRNFEIEIPKQTMDSVATVKVSPHKWQAALLDHRR